jgi:uncharacterized protein with NRDE domain
MCLLAILYRVLDDAPLLVAANREEYFDRPALPPSVQPGRPRVLCGLDRRAGGTWLGVNEHGLIVAVTNRAKTHVPPDPPSRGLLCRRLLEFEDAEAAAEFGLAELATGRYAGANYVCVDAAAGFVLHGGDRVEQVALQPGLQIITNGDLNDGGDRRIALARRLLEAPVKSIEEFIERARQTCSRGSDASGDAILLRHEDRGTVSSTVLALTRESQDAVYLYAPGPPDVTEYDDYSRELRGLASK